MIHKEDKAGSPPQSLRQARLDRRAHIHFPRSLAEGTADRVTTFTGSWTFLGCHLIWFFLWITLHVEPFPFGLLTMIVSLEAIVLSTLVMMSQNRGSARDGRRDDREAEEVHLLFAINQQQLVNDERQLEILTILRGQQLESS